MNDIKTLPSTERWDIIFSSLFMDGISFPDKKRIVQAMVERSLEGTALSVFGKKIFQYMETQNAVPTFEYMVQIEGFNVPITGTYPTLSVSDILAVIDEEVEFQRKFQFANDIINIAQDLNSPIDEMANRVTEATQGLSSGRGVYVEPLDIMEVYRRTENDPLGPLTFIEQIDDYLKGLKPGNIMTVGGFVGSFKTTFGINFAYNNAKQGYNVGFLTLEVPRDYIRFMLLSRHSYDPKFATIGDPVEHESLHNRELTKEEKKMLGEVNEDFKTDKSYGKIYVLELFDFSSISYNGLKSYLGSLPEPIDILIVDYIQLFQYIQDRSIRLDNVTSMIDYFVRQFTMLCQNFNGRKLSGLLLSQTNRQGYLRATENKGSYDLLALSEARELERSSFAVVFLYTNEELKEAGEIKVTMPKNRGGRVITEPFITNVDPRYCVMGDSLASFGSSIKADFTGLLTPGHGFGG